MAENSFLLLHCANAIFRKLVGVRVIIFSHKQSPGYPLAVCQISALYDLYFLRRYDNISYGVPRGFLPNFQRRIVFTILKGHLCLAQMIRSFLIHVSSFAIKRPCPSIFGKGDNSWEINKKDPPRPNKKKTKKKRPVPSSVKRYCYFYFLLKSLKFLMYCSK